MPHLLVVDNSKADCQFVQGLLAVNGQYTVACASGQSEANQLIAKQAPQAVLVDTALEDCDPIKFVEQLHEQLPFVPILLVSSKGYEREAISALRKGASSYVPKDLLAEELLPTLTDLLEYKYQEHCHDRMLKQLAEVHCKFVLENDRGLIPPLVGYLQEHISRVGICDSSDVTRVGIALDEALVNAVFHGNLELDSKLREQGDAYQRLAKQRMHEKPYCDRQLHVEATITPQVAEILIKDEGPGFDPKSLPDPRDPANLEKVSGRGVLLMQTFMDEVTFNAKGNCVILRKYAMNPPTDDAAVT